jgi:hypothetical protein
MQKLAENLWIQHYPLNMLGGHQGRVVTIIRLLSGKLIIHSTAPFTRADFIDFKIAGTPSWLVDSMLRHDTFAKEGQAAFHDLPYYAPEGFAPGKGIQTLSLANPPTEWAPEIRIMRIDGMPEVQEYVFLHVPSRTLIVADLVFNFEENSGWKGVMRQSLMGVKKHPDCARLYPRLIKDRASYDRSIRELLTWDFDRIIVGHKDPIESGGKEGLKKALDSKGMLPK